MATANELRQMTSEELGRMAGELQQSLFDLGLKHRTGHLENTAQLGRTRRELARLMTLRREGELEIVRKVKVEPAKTHRRAKGEEKVEAAAGGEEKKAPPKKARATKAPAKAAAKSKKSKE
ncbi:MAG: 50S ribosomal protein L29 [Deltaproteobacteria bacterium]